MKQLTRLARPFPARYVEQLPGKGHADYVSHAVVAQALLYICGPYDFAVVEIVREGRDNTVAGVLARLTADIDGRTTSIVEAGNISGQEKLDGERLKNATSDAFKRCAMRLGLGLHLWAQHHYFLDTQFAADLAKGKAGSQ